MEKNHWCLYVLVVMTAFCLTGCSGCFLNKLFLNPHPMTFPDFDFRYPLDFAVGDRFELLQNMYLYDNMPLHDDMGGKAELWMLNRDSHDANAGPLKRVVPAGEVAEIMALKVSRYQGYLFVYLQMESGEKWVVNYSFEWPDGHYNRELFRKLALDVSQ